MSDDVPRRMIEIGVLPRSGEIFFEGADDPIASMIREGGEALDRERAATAKAVASMYEADLQRVKATRSARIARRFRRALKMFARG
jgi:hypothetical protein